MSSPVIVPPDTFLGLRNGKYDSVNARWVVPMTTTAILFFPVISSGNSEPYVKVRVSWGDGSIEETDLRPIGRAYNYIHEYSEIGEYHILVEVYNTDFLERDDSSGYAKTSVTVRVEDTLKPLGNSEQTSRWRGLALPKASLQATYRSVDNDPTTFVTPLVSPATTTQKFVVVGQPEVFSQDAIVTITEPGKLITTARVVSVDESIVYLDAELNDNYSLAAVLDVRMIGPSLQAHFNTPTIQDWFFPSSPQHTLVQSAIRMILSTRLYERVMLPEFGSNLHQIPFEPNDPLVESLVRRYTLEAIQRYEPRAEIIQFSITRDNNDLLIKMVARVQGDDQTVPIEFQLAAAA